MESWRAVLMAIGVLLVISLSGEEVTSQRDVGRFHGIDLRGDGRVYITQGWKESVTVEAEEDLMPYISTKVKDGILVLKVKSGWKWWKRMTTRVVYRVTVKDLKSLNISGSGELFADLLETEKLEVSLNGSGNVGIKRLDGEQFSAMINGSGKIEVRGSLETLQIQINGSGDFDGGDLQATGAAVSIMGSGNARVWCKKTLSVSIVGSGSVDYFGNPEVVTSIMGSGSVKSLGEK